MILTTAQNGNRLVKSCNQNSSEFWESRLYVNGGKTATTTSAKHKTLKSAEKWAIKQVSQ